jgi:hypothetical protein
MRLVTTRLTLGLAIAIVVCATAPGPADEGMWPVNRFPTDLLEKAHGFAPTPEWLAHAQQASVRLAGGCSGSFVSPRGLVMTNYHCAVGCVEALSSKQRNLSATGFLAAPDRDEAQCPGMELNQLTSITDVTARVAAEIEDKEGERFEAARRAAFASIQSECATGANVRCDVVELYHGAKYDLYKYRRFQDVRLVFAPEFDTGFFGGDPDNFMFPRFNLDLAFLRVYEAGQPLRSPEYFRWSQNGGQEGELVFVTGHPGTTSRLFTLAQLEFDRDVRIPYLLMTLSERRGLLTEFQRRGPEQARVSGSLLVSIENALKVFRGQFAALAEPALFTRKREQDSALRDAARRDSALNSRYGGSWDEIARVSAQARELWPRFTVLGSLTQSALFRQARRLLRLAEERAKPNEQRLPEYNDAALPAVEQQIKADTPYSKELEIVLLTYALTHVREQFGLEDEATKNLLGRRSPEEVATEAIQKTTLDRSTARIALMTGGRAAIEASSDPLVRLARAIDSIDRAVRKQYEDRIGAELTRNTSRIAQAMFAIYGDRIYPDATFTLRVTYGTIRGWMEGDRPVPPFTTLAGLYARHTGSPPFKLPAQWLEAKPRVKVDTPFNLVADTDIIGGNSGSPLLNRNAEIVGLVFDGNIHSIGGEYWFDPAKNRTVAVDSRGIREALRSVYGATRILDEIETGAAVETSGAPGRR